jgi:1-acyl-sn-glycerol-3-phosphate acyltransferase
MSAPSDEVLRTAERLLVEQALEFMGSRRQEEIDHFRASVSKIVGETPREELLRVIERVRTTGEDWGYQPMEPFARRVHYAMADYALAPASSFEGGQHLEALPRGTPIVFLPNHLSYADANLFEILAHRAVLDHLTSRLVVVAGPKVYQEMFRRFLSLCFATIKTPQSSSRSSGEAVMPAREVARIARETIALALERIEQSEALLVFVEGSRSRSAAMQPALAAVSRYFECERTVLVPVGITGSERLVPVGDEHVHPTRVTIRIGRPFEGRELIERADGKRQVMMDTVGLRIAEVLPPSYRGVYGDDAPGLAEAREVAGDLG